MATRQSSFSSKSPAFHLKEDQLSNQIRLGRINDEFFPRELEAGRKITSALTPMLHSVGMSDSGKAEILPFLVHLEAIIYSADGQLERHQANPLGEDFDFEWVEHLRQLCLGKNWPMGNVAPLLRRIREYCLLETEAVTNPDSIGPSELHQLVDLRCVDLDLLTFIASERVSAPWRVDLREMLKDVFALKDIEDDLKTTERDRQRGTFNCYNLASRLWGSSTARAFLDSELESRNERLTTKLRAIGIECVTDFAVFAGEAKSAAEAASIRIASRENKDTRKELIERIDRGSIAGYSYYWKIFDDIGEQAGG